MICYNLQEMRLTIESKKQRIPSKKEHKEEINSKLLAFFIASFKYSQGDPTLQQLFFEWAIQTNQITINEQKIFCSIKLNELIRNFHIPQNHAKISKAKIKTSLQTEIAVFSQIIKKSNYNLRTALLKILKNIILRDYRYLNFTERPNRNWPHNLSKKQFIDSIHDYRASHIRKYVFAPQNVRNPIFSQLFFQLFELSQKIMNPNNTFDKKSDEADIKSYLFHIEKRWESLHPQEKFFPQD